MKNERLIASLSKISAPADHKEAMLHGILERADEALASLEKEREMKSNTIYPRKNKKRHGARWLIPVAAVLVALIVLMSIPAVSQAVKNWFYDISRADRYLYVPADEREHDPDLDSAIMPAGELEQTNEILLLSELEEYAERDAERKKNGHPAYDPAEWAWLKDIEPVITDVYYDGVDFMVMTFFPCDPRPFMSGFVDSSISPMRLDILTFDDMTVTNLATGETQVTYACGHGLTPQPDYRNEDGSANVEAMLEDGGVWLYDEYVLPYDKQLEPGRYRIEIMHRILDDHVGEMSSQGTVAACKQSFVLDTTKALAAIEEEALPLVSFAGSYPIALIRWNESNTDFSLKDFDLDGLSVTPTVQKRPTGLRVALDYDMPSAWDEETVQDVIWRALSYELFVDGVSAGQLWLDYDGARYVLDIPMTASERASCRSLVLRPVIVSMQAIVMDGVEHPLADGITVANATNYEPVNDIIPIEGCEIVIPVG